MKKTMSRKLSFIDISESQDGPAGTRSHVCSRPVLKALSTVTHTHTHTHRVLKALSTVTHTHTHTHTR